MNRKTCLLTQFALIAVSLALSGAPASAQNATASQSATGAVRTNSKMLYHGGPVRTGTQNVYFIFYGCWTDACGSAGDTATVDVLTDFIITIGNTPYLQINSTYTDGAGQAVNGAIIFGGSVFDNSYSHGVELTESDITGIIEDQIGNFQLPQDPQGIYVVMASADVSSTATGFCTPDAPPFHGVTIVYGSPLLYVFLGNPNRCPFVAGAPFGYGPTPNDSFAGDAMTKNLAHALNGLLTNPLGNGWYNRYGLENADKCTGTYGQIYPTANGSIANIRLGSRDFLLEQNWVNNRKGGCALRR